MSFTIEAVYEDRVLKLAAALPLQEHAKVKVAVQEPPDVQRARDAARGGYEMFRWKISIS